mmetsp:Transcript_17813/g.33829  ORF Transcript_17813/g.33829 Transcript_17813/m.33829 type:complete len:467 (-) Transcript_17813:1429-2829(-)|eukprot:scaffold10660_cov176-Amphora_coffeaeformis.AAC.8
MRTPPLPLCLLFLFWRPNVSLGAVFNFGITVDSATVDLSSSGDPTEAVHFNYTYDGSMPSEDVDVVFKYVINEYNCSTLFANFQDSTKAMYFDSFVTDAPNDIVDVYLGIDLEDIASSSLWTSTGEFTGELKFCGRFEVYYDGTLVNFHETALTTSVNLLEGGGYVTDTLDLDLVQTQEVGETAEVDVDYPLTVFCCDNNIFQTSCADSSGQGDPIQLCVKLLTPEAGVFVDDIYNFRYSSLAYPETVISSVTNGSVQDQVTEVDCTQGAGVCRIKFVPDARLFVADPMVNNALIIAGDVVIGFGTDTRRVLAVRMLEEEEKGLKLRDFRSQLGILRIVHETKIIFFFHRYIVEVFLAVALACLFIYTRRRPDSDSTIVEKADEDGDSQSDTCTNQDVSNSFEFTPCIQEHTDPHSDSSREDLFFDENLPNTNIEDESEGISESDDSKWSYTDNQGDDDNYDMEMG